MFRYLTIASFILIFYHNLLAQDFIIKRDSSIVEAKVLEVSSNYIKFQIKNVTTVLIEEIAPNDIAYIKYKNGYIEKFNYLPTIKPHFPEIEHQKLSDFITCNVQLGCVVNHIYSNLPKEFNEGGHISRREFNEVSSHTYYTNATIGINLLFGKSPYIRAVLGVNYLRSHGRFNYDYYAAGPDEKYHLHLAYNSKVDYMNIVSGLKFPIGKHLYVLPLVAINMPIYINEQIYGYETHDNYVTTTFKEIPPTKAGRMERITELTFSLCPKINYELMLGKHRVGLFASYNMAYQYKLPWYTFGFIYYPFKLLRTELDVPKIKWFKN